MTANLHLSVSFLCLLAAWSVAASGGGWHFVQNGTSGIIALESIIVSDTLAIFFDRATNDPLEVDGHPAWGALYNLETNTASPLTPITDSFCASGGFLSNGTMVNAHSSLVLILFSLRSYYTIGQRGWAYPRYPSGSRWPNGLEALGALRRP